MSFRKLLLKMQCCIVGLSALVTAGMLWLMENVINATISGTVFLVYGIGLGLLTWIIAHDYYVNRDAVESEPQERLPDTTS